MKCCMAFTDFHKLNMQWYIATYRGFEHVGGELIGSWLGQANAKRSESSSAMRNDLISMRLYLRIHHMHFRPSIRAGA